MYEEPKHKPIRGLLQDISQHNDTYERPPRGLVSPRVVDRITALASLVSLLLVSGVFLAMIWSALDLYLGLRCIGSTVVVLLTIIFFRSINTLFG